MLVADVLFGEITFVLLCCLIVCRIPVRRLRVVVIVRTLSSLTSDWLSGTGSGPSGSSSCAASCMVLGGESLPRSEELTKEFIVIIVVVVVVVHFVLVWMISEFNTQPSPRVTRSNTHTNRKHHSAHT